MFTHRVRNREVELFIFKLRVSNSKWNFLFSNFELVAGKQSNKSLTFKLVTQSEN